MSHDVVSNLRAAMQIADSRCGDETPNERGATVKSPTASSGDAPLGLENVPGWKPPATKLQHEAGARSLADAGSMGSMGSTRPTSSGKKR